MAYHKRHLYWLLLSCVILAEFSGCTTDIPITKSVFNGLENNPPIINKKRQEPKKPEDLQYYVSSKITLKLKSQPLVYTVDEVGNLIITRTKTREVITIGKNKYGKLRSPATDGNGNLLVYFEKEYPNSYIRFGQLREGDNERYYLLYDDIQNSTIRYGNCDYTVFFDIDEHPYLFIKYKYNTLPDSDKRTAEGWLVYE